MSRRSRAEQAKGVLWRACYELLALGVPASDWTFMNYGYAAAADEALLPLAESDEPDRLCIQLYAHVLGGVDLAGRDVLEVGSGRGGGASYVGRYRNPRSMTGLDFSRRAVALSNRRLGREGAVRFVHGDAQAMPFPDATFDAVINIESSHCYPSMTAFLAEVHRVLRPGGTFCFADFRSRPDADALREQLSDAPLTMIDVADLTERVVAALRADDARKRTLITKHIPTVVRSPFRRFAGMVGSTTYTRFAEGSTRYLCARLTKQ